MSDPQIRELQYKLAHGGDRFKLEVTNEAPREVRNVRVPEGASEGERAEAAPPRRCGDVACDSILNTRVGLRR